MKIVIEASRIVMEDCREDRAYTVLKKPELEDYRNVTDKPLVVCYHIPQETIWEHFCACMRRLEADCHDDSYFACYVMFFSELFPSLLSSAQVKNVLACGMENTPEISLILRDFLKFLKEGNSLIVMPEASFSFSVLLNASCHVLLYNLDWCDSLSTVCDAITKVKQNGVALFYTVKDNLPDELTGVFAGFQKSVFASCTVYSMHITDDFYASAYENSSEALVISQTERLLAKINELGKYREAFTTPSSASVEIYSYAIELLNYIEKLLLELYDRLDNSKLPVYANLFKEAVMNYYIGSLNQLNTHTYAEKLQQAAQTFWNAAEAEF